MVRESFEKGVHGRTHPEAWHATVFVNHRDVSGHRMSPGKEIRAGNGERQSITTVESFARNPLGGGKRAKLKSTENLSTDTCQTMPNNLWSASGRINPRKKRECRRKTKAGALPGLARVAPHPTYVGFGPIWHADLKKSTSVGKARLGEPALVYGAKSRLSGHSAG